jgi:T-complex protein 1 subunit theta
VIEILDELVEKGSESMDVRNKNEVVLRMRAAVASKQFGQEDILCPLVADVCYPSIRSATISITMIQLIIL